MDIFDYGKGLTPLQMFMKRLFDLFLALLGLLFSWWIIFFAWLFACIDTRSNGFFVQQRVGQYGRLFNVIKIKTMRPDGRLTTSVTRRGDPRITKLGVIFRRTKIDELPQLWNVLIGEMSFVGPRPDVPGFADKLKGEDLLIIIVRPGITSPATLKYRNEELLLSKQPDPELYNKNIIFPDKVRMNREYIENYSFWKDIVIILKTII